LKLSSFPNLTHLDLSFDGDFRLFNNTFERETKTNTTLFIRLNRDNIKSNSIEINAFNGAKRPIQLFFDSYKDIFDPIGCQLMRLEEEIYAPFLASNPYNQIHIMWCPIVCDCSVKWLFDAPKDWWRRVDAGDSSVGLQCNDHRSLYFYSDYDFRNCPKTNLLKYFVENNSTKSTTIATEFLSVGSENDLSHEMRTTISSEIDYRNTTDVRIESTIITENVNSVLSQNSTDNPISLQNSSETSVTVSTQNLSENSLSAITEEKVKETTLKPMTTKNLIEYSLDTLKTEGLSQSTSKITTIETYTENPLNTVTKQNSIETLVTVSTQNLNENSLSAITEEKVRETTLKPMTTKNLIEYSLDTLKTEGLSQSTSKITTIETYTESPLNTVTKQNSIETLVTVSTQNLNESSLSAITEEKVRETTLKPMTTKNLIEYSLDTLKTEDLSQSTSKITTTETYTESPLNTVTKEKFFETSMNKIFVQNSSKNSLKGIPNEGIFKKLMPQDLSDSSATTTTGRITESSLNTFSDLTTIQSISNGIITKELPSKTTQSKPVTENSLIENTTEDSPKNKIFFEIHNSKPKTENSLYKITTEFSTGSRFETTTKNSELNNDLEIIKDKVVTELPVIDMTQVSNKKDLITIELQTVKSIMSSTVESNPSEIQESTTRIDIKEDKTESNTKNIIDENVSDDNIDYLTLDTRNSSSEKLTTTMNTLM
jgi:hypothetical protein